MKEDRVAIREWRPGYGPEPVKVERQQTRAGWAARKQSAWARVWCPRVECINAEGYLIYAPVASDGRAPLERYGCAICGEAMRQEPADVQRR